MLSLRKLSAAVLAGVMCIGCAGMTAYADTEETTEAAAAAAPEEITSGEYTYHIDEEYGGAVITAYEPDEADVVLPEEIDGVTVVGLGDFIFNMQDGIETVTIPDNLCHIGASAFYGTSITEFIVSDTHPMYKTEDGVLFSKDGIAIVAYPPKKTDKAYVIPDGVEEIYHGCFASNTYITEHTLPDGLIYIDTWAFAYTTIQELDIPDTVTEIGGYAFAYMTRLTDIETPPQLQIISGATFAGCANLDTVTLNEGLLEIGQSAFAGTGVRDIVIPTTVTEIGYCALGYDTNLSTSYSTLVIYGLSGSAAQKVGQKLKQVSGGRQIICVTHLAQVAAYADNHMLISKSTEDGKTFTSVESLGKEGRVNELARIMGGSMTDSFRKSAEELLELSK